MSSPPDGRRGSLSSTGRNCAATVAASVRPDPEVPAEIPLAPTPPSTPSPPAPDCPDVAGVLPPGDAALRTLAADPATLGPTRLPCPGPWWDAAEHRQNGLQVPEVTAEREALEARLGEAGGSRVWAQQQACAELAARGEPVTRLSVARLACELLDRAELIPC